MSIKKEKELKESVQRLQKAEIEFLRLLGELNRRVKNQDK